MHSTFIMACQEADSGKSYLEDQTGVHIFLYRCLMRKMMVYCISERMEWAGSSLLCPASDGSIKYSYNTRDNFLYYKDYVLLSNEKNKPV